MDDKYALSPLEFQKEQTMAELKECNQFSQSYGLSLNDNQIVELAKRRFEALRNTGRVEFKKGILKKLVAEFCDSPYISQENYEETLTELQEAFYYFKNESMDTIPDDELISFMKRHFDGHCQGSIDYLAGTTLEELCRGIRGGDADLYEPLF